MTDDKMASDFWSALTSQGQDLSQGGGEVGGTVDTDHFPSDWDWGLGMSAGETPPGGEPPEPPVPDLGPDTLPDWVPHPDDTSIWEVPEPSVDVDEVQIEGPGADVADPPPFSEEAPTVPDAGHPVLPEEHPAAPYEGDYSIEPEPEFTPESLGMPSEAELAAEAGEGLELSEILEGAGEGGEIAAEAAEGVELVDVLEIGALLLL